MLDQFIWGRVARISPEAPVPVVDFVRESFMPGGAANVARNLSAFNIPTEMFTVVGADEPARRLKKLLQSEHVGCQGLTASRSRRTSIKTRIVAHQQQVVRVDRETRADNNPASTRRLLDAMEAALPSADAVIVADYGKGIVTQELLDGLRDRCRARGLWLSMDPKPVHSLDLSHLSLLTPNRKEAFELAGMTEDQGQGDPLRDTSLKRVATRLFETLNPALLLITLGDQGMLLCQRGQPPFLTSTVAREVFDVSGAGDTVIASFTLAIAAGASPMEAAILSNHAAGVVVGKMGTATVTAQELVESLKA